MSWRRKRVDDEIAEECCFSCKDSGDELRVCDFKNCLKSYHPCCTGKGDDFLTSDEQFICDWHTCVNCKGSSDYQCLCCPHYSLCHDCLGKVEFVQVRKQNKGFCRNCLNLAISSEKNAGADPHGAKIDYRDLDIYEILFKDYWGIIKDRERLTLVDLQEASDLLDSSLNCKSAGDSEKFPDEDHKSDENLFDVSDDNGQTFPFDSKGKPNKISTSLKKNKSNKITYVGWGSEALIEFLSYLGKDTAKPLDEFEAVGVVKEYIRQKNLFQDKKKKSFFCDDKLRSLFKRRKMKCNKIHRFLVKHFAANAEDESLDGSEDDERPIMRKKPRTSLEPKIARRVSERNKRCFASLNQNNIKLIYLRRSLAIKLLSHPDTFEQKVVGCFVRVKNNPKVHIYQMSKKAYQIGLVTGIKKHPEEYKIKDKVKDTSTDIILCVTGVWDDVKISMLSDEDIEEDECNNLIPLVEKGLLKRITVADLEEKVATVHKDIVNHWIDKELVRLAKEIDRAHEKGWHAEMENLMLQKKLLSTTVERQRRLAEVPEIIADTEDEKRESEREIGAGNSSQENRGKKRVRASCLMDMEESSKGAAEHVAESFEVLKEKPPEGATEQVVDALSIPNEESSEGAADQVANYSRLREEESPEGATGKMADSLGLCNKESSEVASKQGDATREVPSEAGEALSTAVTLDPALHSQLHNTQGGSTAQAVDIDKDEGDLSRRDKGSDKVVINLDSDDDEDLHTQQREPVREALHAPTAMNGRDLHMERTDPASRVALHSPGSMNKPAQAAMKGISPLTPMWHYVDPQGEPRGPFPLVLLSQWRRVGFFGDDFRVWRTGQTVAQAILLKDAFKMNL
uniref:GYF domain-containing protein n=1 Tax=Arundo donax TaxID=35708 RepID=A0A0A9F4D9_ARUDO